MTKNVIRKTVAIITAVTIWTSVAGPALADTVSDLQAQINALLAQLSSLQSQLAALQGGTTGGTVSCTITSFTRNLKQGMSGDDVKCLQIILNSAADTQLAPSGVGSSGNETTYFGPLTKAAVIKFQEKYASEVLASWGLTSGTGFVGSTTRTKLDTFLTGGGGVIPGGEVGTAATISLAADTPAAAQVALGSQDVVFTKLKFTAGADAYTVSKVVVARGGVSADTDISAIKLFDGSTQIGSTQALNTNTHKATFSSLSWDVPSYGVKYLLVKASIAGSGTATVGDGIQLGVAASSDITSTVTLAGAFPMMGNARTIAGISVGEVWVQAQATPASTTLLSGATDQEIACWRIQASSSEAIAIHSLTVTHVGTAARGDMSNLKLKVTGAQIGSTVAELDSSNQVTFDLSSSPLEVLLGGSKTVCAYADVAAGIWTARTIKFEITQYTDVTAYGSNSGGSITASYNDTTAFAKQTGNTMTVGQGTLAVALDNAENPAAQSYVKGTTDRKIIAVKFTTGATEGVRVTKLRFALTGAVTDISNFTLWDGSTQIAGPASAVSGYVTFGANTIGWDTTGLFDLEKSNNKTLVVKADIPTGATASNQVQLTLANSDVWADGLDSQYDVPSASITGSATGNTHTISGNGSLTASLASDSPAAQSYVKGSTEKVFTKINLTAGSGEDILVSSIKVYCYTTAGQTTACTNGTTTNVKLMKSDGTQYGITVANPTASATFSGNLVITASETATLSVVADIPTGSGASYLHWDIKSATVATDLTSTGVSSGVDITETGSVTGKTMTVGQGTLTISAAPTPGDQTRIIGAYEVPVLGLVMTAGTGENVRVSSIQLTTCTTDEGTTTDISNIALYDGDTRLTSKKNLTASSSANHYVTFSASDFLNSTGIEITKGQQKTITVKVDLPTTASSSNDIALGIDLAANVVVTGLASNASLSPTLTPATSNLTGVNYVAAGDSDAYELTLASAGVLTLARSADTPLEQIQSVSIEGVQVPGVSFLKTYLKGTLEEIDVKSISIERKGGAYSRDSDFASVSLYDGDGNLLAGPQALSSASTTFNFVEGSYWRIPIVGTKNLIVKATLNGIRGPYGYGSQTGDVPTLCIDNTTVQGVDSGSTSITGAGVPSSAICSNVQIIRQGQPTIALASPTTGSYGAGQKELIRWTVSADAFSSIVWKKVVFDVSGSVQIGSDSYTIGCVTGNNTCGTQTAGVYMASSSDEVATQLIATSSMQIWDANTNSQVSASTTPSIRVDQSTATGTARISFVAATEQEVAAGATKTYYLVGNILHGGLAGDTMLTKIESRSTATTTSIYATVAGTTATFVWSDNSGASAGAHSSNSADWTNDYKVSGIPTATKTLSR